MSIEKPTSWETYEEVARLLLDKIGDALGLRLESIEGKQTLVGASGTKWEIDAKGVSADGEAVVVIECRRYPKSSLKQSDMAALAWTINDLGASGGIVVTPIGVQKGGQLVAAAAGIKVIQLDADSSTESYLLKFLGDVFVGPGRAHLTLMGGVPEIRVAPAKSNE
ncbi:hypothetical protein AOT83_19045 [Mycobacteroides sp. H001]|uniref:restriction endonuclease n=1 Tax=Mycobacteroides TaxID=670516 RepID=UPI0007162C39|nr:MULTISPECIES: restriction endonuclease [Mycobacteroides]KRQ26418.1 hypothetical protein AOT86_11405 [Mycobacteroides sp. H072]KRQ32618.1 hypothetical protein AOT84_20675 [Mycobacteroides sp. H002]KRQ54044.1 hypothetical protein AOT85_05175 [Mycobacteroides sp. H054]KRQ68016.1 hypothetical protein AOT83_19045 [Mycobacteroides sp. H001]OHU42829.1 hypothetical protein BKG79_02180 [Mycobacteroides chelonae]